MTHPAITSATLEHLRITPKTIWSFVRLSTDDGHVGFGEASLPNRPAAVLEAANTWLADIVGRPAAVAEITRAAGGRSGLGDAAVVSALDMALHDVAGQAEGVPVHARLGGAKRDEIALYANINRATTDRSPAGFAATAERALKHGFSMFKLAPFDELSPEACEGDDFAARLDAGLARVAATRAVIGPEARLRVDCHWRFTEPAAQTLIEAAVPLGLDWIECPIAETPQNAAAIAGLRQAANREGIRLAGLEMGVGLEAFAPYLEAGAYDVIMPDVKYLGGLALMLDLAALAGRHGAILSLHNPTGPLCHAASLHVSAALPAYDSLEMQFDESPLFDALLDGPPFTNAGGKSAVPGGPGLGAALDMRRVADLRVESLA